jgi:hypothetical protein
MRASVQALVWNRSGLIMARYTYSQPRKCVGKALRSATVLRR